MEQIGAAAWRVLGKARKAAIARRNDEEAEKRGPALSKVATGISPATRQSAASPTVGERSGLERTRKKRPTGL